MARRDAEFFASAGVHSLRWNPGVTAAGTYFVRLTTDSGETDTKTWVVLR